MDDLERYLWNNHNAEIARIGLECIKTNSADIADVAAMLDSEDIRKCIQSVCIGASNEDIGAAFKEAVKASIGMLAENNLIKQFEQG